MDLIVGLILLTFNVCYVKGIKAATKRDKKCSQFKSQTEIFTDQNGCFQIFSEMSSIRKACYKNYHATCKSKPSIITFVVSKHMVSDDYNYVIHLNMTSMIQEQRKGCWGALLRYKTTDDSVEKCQYKQIMEEYVEFPFEFYTSKTYTYNVTLLPTGDTIKSSWTSPSQCELSTSDYVKSAIKRTYNSINYCFNRNPKVSIRKFTKAQCEKHNFDKVKVTDMLNKKLEVTENCSFLLTKTEPNEGEDLQKDYLMAIVVLCIGLFFILLLTVACFVKGHAKRSRAISYDSKEEQKMIESKNSVDGSTSVMILNRPGCELLEVFLRDFAFVLSSYGVKVKMSLLEQSEIDAEGGIASYMQKHINECDYILIMCTENTNEHNVISRHRPYEFAVRMIGGLAFHQNDSSRYIPIYLSSYKEAVKFIPSFVNASMSFGYQVPKDIKKLLLRITSEKQLQTTADRTAKDKFFINKMENQRKKIMKEQHLNCIKEYCTKGMCHGSVVNLSSIWPTTVHSSKWSSSDSVAKNIVDDIFTESTS
ncbi:uncharacterized protein LOC130625701 [Hydractinia symbiolongicarpus]|uniref:uncharacterized protein LOC130625701 n=1 Tax=Hydractinia symbiolongicarpus TaxID=13093 RepID=UPI00254EF8E6|nr:uncharacterized protein LOC130625701 [Hydractinia symbiolongicarpus]